ncbi:hypothetical protein JOM56_011829 [Amanita muscaria]
MSAPPSDCFPVCYIQIVWSVLPGIFLGLYSASLIHCIRWLLFEDEGWRIRKKINWWLVATTLLVFFLSTALFCAVAMSTFPTAALNAVSYFVFSFAYSNAMSILGSSAVEWSVLILIDSVMIYRCWIVFSKNWFMICFPVALWCFCLICEILSFYCTVEFLCAMEYQFDSAGTQMCFTSHYVDKTPMAFYMCNIMINIYTTCTSLSCNVDLVVMTQTSCSGI